MTEMEHFEARVIRSDGCWLWKSGHGSNGRPLFSRRGFGMEVAARTAYRLFRGQIPDGLQVLHECDNHRCVNPAHLKVGTQSQNMLDCSARGRWANQNSTKTACVHGHELRGRNLILRPNGQRDCRACKVLRDRASRRRVSARAALSGR